jgi:hypothetical protein
MQYEPFSTLYFCDTCKENGWKKNRGCKINKKNGFSISLPCFCGGYKKCEICKGKQQFIIKRCPYSYASEFKSYDIIKYYFHYRKTNQYPDGQPMILQPLFLLNAFNIMSFISNKKEFELSK